MSRSEETYYPDYALMSEPPFDEPAVHKAHPIFFAKRRYGFPSCRKGKCPWCTTIKGKDVDIPLPCDIMPKKEQAR